MPVVKKSQTLPPSPVVLLIFGEGGLSKTSLSSTAKNPFNIDCDRGLKRSYGKPDALIIEQGWKEVLAEEAAGTYKDYDTIIIDTAKGAIDDFIAPYVCETDYRLKTNTLKRFGAMGDEFKSFVSRLRDGNKDIIIIAHSKTEQDGDMMKKIPDVTGSSSQLLLRIADQVGYVSMRNGKRTISFNPTDTTAGKNVGGLPDIEFPHHETPEWENFCDREIIQKVKDSLSKMSKEQLEAIAFIDNLRAKIEATEGSHEALTELSNEIGTVKEEHLSKQLRVHLKNHLGKIGWKWDKASSKFVPVANDKPAEEKPQATTSTPADDPGIQASDASVKPAINIPAPTGPRIDTNPDQQEQSFYTPPVGAEQGDMFEPKP